MIKTIKRILICLGIYLTLVFMGYVQDDHVVGTVADVNGTEITFELDNGHQYVWEDKRNTYEVGDKYKIDMFDFENFNPYDDAIVKVRKKINE